MNTPVSPSLQGPRRLQMKVASGDALDVRTFHVEERMNELFVVTIEALSEHPTWISRRLPDTP